MRAMISRETFGRVAVAALLLVALGAACRGRGRGPYDFTWLHGGTPVSGVAVTFLDDRGRTLVAGPLQNGRIRAPQPAASVRVVDPAHDGVVLLEQPLANARSIRVPEAIRVRFRVDGARPDTVVRVGSGPRVAPAERYTIEHGKQWMRHDGDGEAFGVPVAPSASRWRAAARTAQDLFDSGWIPATAAPQVVALDTTANLVSVSEVALPSPIAHGATLDGGTVTLQPSRTIDLEVAVARGELPPALMVALIEPSIDAARRDEIGRATSVLDQIDERVFEHVLLRAPIYVPSSGHLRLAGLPPLDGLTVAVLDVDRGTRVTRAVRFTSDTPVAAVSLDLAGPRGPRRVVRGRVVAANLRPIAAARVVLSDVPDRFETTTDANGEFAFPSVQADRYVTLFVDPPASAAAVSTAQIFRAIDSTQPMMLALPHPATLLAVTPGPPGASAPGAPQITFQCGQVPTSNEQYPSVAGQLNSQWAVARILQEDWAHGQFIVMPSATGNWIFYMFETPFVGFRSQEYFIREGDAVKVDVNIPFNKVLDQVRLRFVNQNLFPITHTTISFPSLLPDPDPIELDTDGDGNIYLNCVNASPIAAYVHTADGWCYDGDLNLTSPFMQVVLQRCSQEPRP